MALAGFGLDSLIEIGASTVVIWELSGTGEERQQCGLRLIGYAFTALVLYLLIQSTWALATGTVLARSRSGKLNRGRERLAFPFGDCCLGQDRPGKLPCLGHGKASPSGSIAAGAVSEIHEDPCGRMPGITEG